MLTVENHVPYLESFAAAVCAQAPVAGAPPGPGIRSKPWSFLPTFTFEGKAKAGLPKVVPFEDKEDLWFEAEESWICTHRTPRTDLCNPFDPKVNGGPQHGDITESESPS